ncbi:MAG: 4'-phosphopantetheinyl transferase family protein [Desulfobulbaceae bacterium]
MGAAILSFFREERVLPPSLSLRISKSSAEPALCLSLLDLTELEELLAAPEGESLLCTHLSPAERSRYDGFTYPGRRREWLGGRLACKAAILNLAGSTATHTMPELAIGSAANGAPILRCSSPAASPLPAISISHSNRYVAAMAAWAESCGIDIQKTTDQILRVVDRFAAASEVLLLRKTLPHLEETQRLTLLWAAKEALKKGVLHDQPAVFQGVTLHALDNGPDLVLRLHHPGGGDRPTRVNAVALDDYFLAYTVEACHAGTP